MIVLVRTLKRFNYKTRKDYIFVSFYNKSLKRFGASCFATPLTVEEARKIRETKFFNCLEVQVQNIEFDIKEIKAPETCPQFGEDYE